FVPGCHHQFGLHLRFSDPSLPQLFGHETSTVCPREAGGMGGVEMISKTARWSGEPVVG
ncbi:Os11g0308432, partial [Oryza sativa Japonica Group]